MQIKVPEFGETVYAIAYNGKMIEIILCFPLGIS